MKETLIEKKSRRKKEAIMLLVTSGEYSKSYSLWLIEELYEWLTTEPEEIVEEEIEENGVEE